MKAVNNKLPQKLSPTLTLRPASTADTKALAEFNSLIHSDHPPQPEMWLAHWTRDLMSGRHPTTGPSDFTLVVENKSGRIISSLALISQTWSYAGIPFGCGRIELVGTEAEYRQQGLINKQMEVIHARSRAKGEQMQVITGIPWFYRRYGYEMCLELHSGRKLLWAQAPKPQPELEKAFHLRPATPADIPHLAPLYDNHCAHTLVYRHRTPSEWQYELTGQHKGSVYHNAFYLVENPTGTPVAYLEYKPTTWNQMLQVRELGVASGHDLSQITAFLVQELKKNSDELNKTAAKPYQGIDFQLGSNHPLYLFLESRLTSPRPAYAWYVRIADLPQFLLHIRPVLAQRLAQSPMAGYQGSLRLNLFQSQFTLHFKAGQLSKVTPFTPADFNDGDALFPDQTFIQLLLGHRSLAALNRARADCYWRSDKTAALLNILFPAIPSFPAGLG